MSELLELGQRAGLDARPGADGELHATCDETAFADLASSFAESASLADLFATTGAGGPSITAVFSGLEDPAWLLLTTRLSSDSFESLTPRIHAASWYEREIKEMFGIEPRGHPAPLRLRLHDWPDGIFPMRDHVTVRLPPSAGPDRMPVVQGQGVLQIPLGPIRSGPQESAEFLFNSGGEDLVMVSPRLGYKFRAIERLAEGQTVEVALALAERLAGTSTFSNVLAFLQAVERGAGVAVPHQAAWARTLLNELERLHSHLGTLSRVADACGLTVAAAQYSALKEEVLRACAALTGHRYLRGALAPGGLAIRLTAAPIEELRGRLAMWSAQTSRTEDLLEDTATFIDRLEGTAVLPVEYASQHNLVGPIGRSSGTDRDARRDHPYAAYGSVPFEVTVLPDGDALARVRVLLFEIRQAVAIARALIDDWPSGQEPAGPVQPGAGAALGWAEAPGGEALHFVELDAEGKVVRWRARPPACVNWHPFAFACASGNNLTDYPVLEASFGLSHAEFDR